VLPVEDMDVKFLYMNSGQFLAQGRSDGERGLRVVPLTNLHRCNFIVRVPQKPLQERDV